jgi:pilus assembly protein Flp/PilA
MRVLISLCHDEAGATAIEYALMAALIAVVIIGAVTLVGKKIQSNFFGPIGSSL